LFCYISSDVGLVFGPVVGLADDVLTPRALKTVVAAQRLDP